MRSAFVLLCLCAGATAAPPAAVELAGRPAQSATLQLTFKQESIRVIADMPDCAENADISYDIGLSGDLLTPPPRPTKPAKDDTLVVRSDRPEPTIAAAPKPAPSSAYA